MTVSRILDTAADRTPTRRELVEFIDLPYSIYRNDPLWVPPLAPRVRAAICKPKTRGFSPAAAFLIRRANEVVARAAAGCHLCDGRAVFGFFEAQDAPEAVEQLLVALRRWAGEHGIAELCGPYNFDFEDGYGVLVQGSEAIAPILCGHSPPYYRALLEGAGLTKARSDALAFRIDLAEPAADEIRLHRIVERMRRRGELRVRALDPLRMDQEIAELLEVVNRAQAEFVDYVPWQEEAFEDLVRSLRRIADPELILVAERRGAIVGWFPGIPSITPNLRRLGGLRRPWQYIRLLGLKRAVDTVSAKSVQVLPLERGRGAALMLFSEMFDRARAKGYRYVDLSLTGEDNPYTLQLATRLGGELYKRYRVYRLDTSTTADRRSSERPGQS